MSLQQLRITHAGGTRLLAAYALPLRTRANALRPERARGGGVRILGDGLELPNALVARAEVPAATLAAAYALAYAIAAEAETATAVRTHEGDQLVQALLGFEMQPHASSVMLTLRWAPAGPTVTPLTPLAYASETTPTVDSTLPTADTDWTPP